MASPRAGLESFHLPLSGKKETPTAPGARIPMRVTGPTIQFQYLFAEPLLCAWEASSIWRRSRISKALAVFWKHNGRLRWRFNLKQFRGGTTG
jgi:hypothetical protein